jgi:hypothetical protein
MTYSDHQPYCNPKAPRPFPTQAINSLNHQKRHGRRILRQRLGDVLLGACFAALPPLILHAIK